MVYVYVTKNADGTFNFVRFIYNTVNVRGNSGTTYGDITMLDLATRLAEGFWTLSSVYVNSGEYSMFDNKVTTFDEATATVIDTYNYIRQPLDVIKDDLYNRVKSKLSELYHNGFVFEGNTFSTDQEVRLNILTTVTAIMTDPASYPSNYIWKTLDDISVPMTADKFKEFSLALFSFTNDLYVTSWAIKAAIEATTTYEDARAAAMWNGESV